MTFAEAFEELKNGKKIKLKNWTGYWKKEKDIYSPEGKSTVFMYCKDGRVLDIRDTKDVIFTLSNMVSEDWEVLE